MTYFQDFHNYIQHLHNRFNQICSEPDEFVVKIGEGLEKEIASSIDCNILIQKIQVIKKELDRVEARNEMNKDKIMGKLQDGLKKTKDKNMTCKKCGNTMIYVSDFKKNLVCKRCNV